MNEEWYTRYFHCPESFADPHRQYELCKARGMDLVTLTDHDTIEGGLALVGLSDFFLSEEITTRFPENGCVMHVLAWNITPAEHQEIQRVRDDIYGLVAYLTDANIAHAMAHPLLSPNWRLDPDTLEKVILLFPTFERANGLLDARLDADLGHLLAGVTPAVVARLAAKHRLAPRGACPHQKALVAGSDDHVHRRSGTSFTEVDGALAVSAFLERVTAGEGRPVGEHADLQAMALCITHTTYSFLKSRNTAAQSHPEPFVDLLDAIAGRAPSGRGANQEDLVARILDVIGRASVPAGPGLDILRIPKVPSLSEDADLLEGIRRVHDQLVGDAVRALGKAVLGCDFFGIWGAMGGLGAALTAAAPLLFAADHFGRQRAQVDRVWTGWSAFPPPDREERLAVFTDVLGNANGVSTWCECFIRQAHQAQKDVVLVGCGDAELPPGESASLPEVASFGLPFYQGLKLRIPSLMGTVDWLWRRRITHVELATPGPMGLVALAAARLLRLPVTSSYHTELPHLIGILSGNTAMATLAERYASRFYGAVDRVLAPSPAAVERLLGMGVPRSKIEVLPVAVDPSDFSPAQRSTTAFEAIGIQGQERPVVLSVGRLSPEKNLHTIVEAVAALQTMKTPPLLVVVGDGPDRHRLDRVCAGKDFVRLVGPQQGVLLRRLYASARMFAFAGEVDTLGIVNLEAMASGIPVLVPKTSSIFRVVGTDVVYDYLGGASGLAEGIAVLLRDPPRAARLGEAGRRLMIQRWGTASFDATWRTLIGATDERTAA